MDTTKLEAALGGRWLQIVGIVLVFVGTAFFLKHAWEHNWVAPQVRVAQGLFAGALAIGYAQYLARKGQVYFSEGITALGVAIEYATLYASTAVLHVASPQIALGGMIGVTAFVSALAWRRKSERLGILAAVGGFATPALVGTLGADQWTLAIYLVALCAGMVTLSELVQSRFVAPIALAGSLYYAFANFAYAPDFTEPERAALFALLYAPFAIAGWVALKRDGRLGMIRSSVAGIALGSLIVGFAFALDQHHPHLLGAALLGLGVAHVTVAAVFRSKFQSWCAAAATTLAIPAGLDQGFMGVAWAAEAVALVVGGLRARDYAFQIFGFILLAGAGLNDFMAYAVYTPALPILNERFANESAIFVALYVIVYAIETLGAMDSGELIARSLRTTAHALALLALVVESWVGIHHFGGTEQMGNAAISIVMAVFAAALIGSGLRKYDTFLRWEGLGLILAAAAKVFVIDLSFVDITHRVISAVLVGIALIVVSYGYQRHLKAQEAEA